MKNANGSINRVKAVLDWLFLDICRDHFSYDFFFVFGQRYQYRYSDCGAYSDHNRNRTLCLLRRPYSSSIDDHVPNSVPFLETASKIGRNRRLNCYSVFSSRPRRSRRKIITNAMNAVTIKMYISV